MDDELIQVVDENDEPLKGASREDVLKNGWRHRIVHALVWNQAGEVLLQKRNDTVKEYPGCWGSSSASYMFENERYDVAVTRTLAEQLGLTNMLLKDIGDFTSEEMIGKKVAKRFNKVFETEVQSDVELRLDPEEISGHEWLTATEVKQLVADEPDSVTDGLKQVAELFL